MSLEENLEEDKAPKVSATWDNIKIEILLDECVFYNNVKTNDGTGFIYEGDLGLGEAII